MTIIKSPDGKVLTNLSGEVLKTAPLIDISSSYGVTKDGSNLVSVVKTQFGAKKFIQPTGANQPLENGSGFVFDGVNDSLYINGFNIKRPFTIKQKFLISNITASDQMLLNADDFGTNRGWSTYFIRPNRVRLYDGILYYKDNVFPDLVGNQDTDIAFSVNINGDCNIYFNGVRIIQWFAFYLNDFSCQTNKVYLGQVSGLATRFFNGKYYRGVIQENYFEKSNVIGIL